MIPVTGVTRSGRAAARSPRRALAAGRGATRSRRVLRPPGGSPCRERHSLL